MQIFEIFSLHDIYLIFFSIALALGMGAAAFSSMLWLTVLRDERLSSDEAMIVRSGRKVGWIAILLYSLSGVGLFTLSYEAMLALGIFQAAMIVFMILVVTQLFVQYWLLPKLLPNEPIESSDARASVFFAFAEIVVLVSWLVLVLHHALYRFVIDLWLALSLYFAMVTLFGYFYLALTRRFLGQQKVRISYVLLGLSGLLFAGTLLLHFSSVTPQLLVDTAVVVEDQEISETKEISTTFTWTEISGHTHLEDCWVVISGEVYDVTPAAEKFPDLYKCGTDITTAYKEMQPEGLSERVRSYQIGSVGYSAEEVAGHNKKDNCWLTIDGMVFDATSEAKLHPAAFNCGTDATVNYHRNHGDGVSEKMMQYYIGRIDDGNTVVPDGNPATKRVNLEPYTELYVEAGSWNNHELMVIVEKDAEKLVFMDGATHEVLGRIHDIGFQPHTSVFSPDAHFMYIIARDGWLTKIDLNTLEPIKSVSVGENSRGTALTENGKYLAIGNYAPGNVVMLDADTLEILKTIPTTGELDGKEVESRVGAVIQKDNDIIVALKDLNSVWVIDTDDTNFEVVEKYWNIGDNQAPLHDAYLTPDGKFYLVAAMGANTVWVLNTETWEEVGEVKTGETPHTGPGATWGTTTYVPAIGEGLITAIDTTTWEPKAYIQTGGPGLFVRSYSKDPTYPYVWADTAFGEHHDEIYVIDARTNEIVETIIPVPGESSWHPEFTLDGKYVYVVSQTANEIEVYDAHTFEIVKRIEANTPSAVSNVGLRIEEPGL
jgi:protein NirF